MAPLRGVTTATYRRVYKAHFDGIDLAMAPFISTGKAARVSNKLVKEVLPEYNINSYPVIPQLIGNAPEDLPPYLDKLIELGCSEVNWNLGCPAPMVTKKKRGSGLLPHPDMIEKYVSFLNQYPGIDYSVKVRAGFQSEDELVSLLPIFEKHNCREITVHPRTGKQGYQGRANPDLFAKIVDNTDIPLIYNGDVLYKEYFDEILNRFGSSITGVMLGRGILINPFLPEQICGREIPNNPSGKIKDFMNALFEEYEKELFGIKPVLGRMKEIWQYLQYAYPGGERAIKKIIKCTTKETYNKRVNELFKHDFIPPKEFPMLEF